jgi:hypothetical protein
MYIYIYIYIFFLKKENFLKFLGLSGHSYNIHIFFNKTKNLDSKNKEKRKEEFFGKYIMFLDNSLFIEMAIPRIDEIYYCKCPLTII